MASKTKDIIINTFLDLLNDYEIDKITVTDIVDNCAVSRQTFYYHFSSVDEMIELAFKAEFKNALENSLDIPNWLEAIQNFVPIFEKYDLLLKNSRYSKKLTMIQTTIATQINEFTYKYYKNKPSYAKKQFDDNALFLMKYSSAAIIGIVFMEMETNPDFNYKTVFNQMFKTFKNTN